MLELVRSFLGCPASDVHIPPSVAQAVGISVRINHYPSGCAPQRIPLVESSVSITIEALAVDLAVHMTKRFRYRRKRGGILLVETGYPGALSSRRQVDRCQCASNVSPCQCRMDVWVALQSKSGEVVSNTKLGGYNA